MAATNGTKLTPQQKSALAGPALSSPFDVYERLFPSFHTQTGITGATVFDYGTADARQLKEMLSRDGNARKVEQVLTLPIRSAAWEIRPHPKDTGEAQLVKDNLGTKLGLLIDQMTSACTYRKAFFELEWALDGDRVVLADIGFRPPASCEAGHDPKTGAQRGFRQRVGNPAGLVVYATPKGGIPGYVEVPAERAFVYTHGQYREPIQGLSDLDVAYWCWETRQKLYFLWFQYLESQSLPKLIAYGDDQTQADANRDAIAEAGASAVIGLQRPNDPAQHGFDVIESSGKGATQFHDAIQYLESMMTASVLASFTDLAALASHSRGQGSYALSADQSEFFLAARQAVADEIADTITDGLFRRLCVLNFGPDCNPPTLELGPLSKHDKARALTLLEQLLPAGHFNCPPGVIDLLTKAVAGFVGLPVDQVSKLVDDNPTPPSPVGAPGGDAGRPPLGDIAAAGETSGLDLSGPSRRVRTAAGEAFYGKPIGSPIGV